MEKAKKISITVFSYIITIAVILFFWEFRGRSLFFEPDIKIKIVEKEKPVFKYIKKAKTVKEYKDCCSSPLEIETKMINDTTMYIRASDNWKMAEQRIKLANNVEKRARWPTFVVGGVAVTVGFIAGGYIMYKVIKKARR